MIDLQLLLDFFWSYCIDRCYSSSTTGLVQILKLLFERESPLICLYWPVFCTVVISVNEAPFWVNRGLAIETTSSSCSLHVG